MRFIKISAMSFAALAMILLFMLLPHRLCFKGGDEYVFFCGDSSKNCREIYAGENAALTRLTLKDVCGEGAVYEEFDLDSFLSSVNAEIVFTEELSDSTNYYCRADLPYCTELYGEQINLHVCIRDGSAKVASPIIFGGY